MVLVRRTQSPSSKRPERNRLWSIEPNEESRRTAIESAGISIEKTIAGRLLPNNTFSIKFMAKVVLPILGRAATMIKSPFCIPKVLLSNSTNPVVNPVIALSLPCNSSTVLRTLFSTLLIALGPLSALRLLCCSLMANTLLST